MPSKEENCLIVEYWFRISLSQSFSIEDILKIIFKFADDFEQFHPSLVHDDIETDDKYHIISNISVQQRLSAFVKLLLFQVVNIIGN